ncbi:oligosaccharide flippase family protein [Rhodococcus hoagii]|nr:oligosaccharide flippase family protein [Prescottella equi]
MAAITYALGPLVATVFSNDALVDIVRWTSVVFVVNGAATQFRAELNRRLDFKMLALVDTVPVMVGLASAVGYVVFVNADYWALICQQLVTATSGLLLAVMTARWFPGLPNRNGSIRSLVSFGLGLFGTQVWPTSLETSITCPWGTSGGRQSSECTAALPTADGTHQSNIRAADQGCGSDPHAGCRSAREVRFLPQNRPAHGWSGSWGRLRHPVRSGGPHRERRLRWRLGSDGAHLPGFGGRRRFPGPHQVTFWVFLAKGATGAQFRFYLVSNR